MTAESALAVSSVLDAASSLVDIDVLRYLGAAAGVIGGIILVCINIHYMDTTFSWRINTWQHVVHPANSVLLIGVFSLVGAALRVLGNQHVVSTIFWLMAAVVRGIQLSLTSRVLSTTANAPPLRPQPLLTKRRNEEAITTDVVVCGSSIAGLMMSSKLGQAGVNVVATEMRVALVSNARFAAVNPPSRVILSRTLDEDVQQEYLSRGVPDCVPLGCDFLNGVCQQDAKTLVEAVTGPPEAMRRKNECHEHDYFHHLYVMSCTSNMLVRLITA